MTRYAITDLRSLPGDNSAQIGALLQMASHWAAGGTDYVQLREKSLPAGALVSLARQLRVRLGTATKLLVNGRADVGVAACAAGVHLTAQPEELTPGEVRRIFALAGADEPVISVSCHSVADVLHARENGADLILFGPVFEKRVGGEVAVSGLGLGAVAEARLAAGNLPLLALGGVTWENAPHCLRAGADGVAGIRLFHRPGVAGRLP